MSARPIWDTAIATDTDVNADINTDLPENSALMMTTDSRLLKCNTQLYPPGLLSARPILDPAIAIDADVSADINADLPENSAPMMNTDSRLLKCNTQVYPPGRDTQGNNGTTSGRIFGPHAGHRPNKQRIIASFDFMETV